MKPIEALRSCQSLLLVRLEEADGSALEVIAKEARAGSTLTKEELAGERNDSLREILRGARAIEHLPSCATFRIRWPSYIGYAMLNESYALPEPAAGRSRPRRIQRLALLGLPKGRDVGL
jgi:hypothetical protein